MRKANAGAVAYITAPKLYTPLLLFSFLTGAILANGQCISTGNANGTVFSSDNKLSGIPFSAAANVVTSDNNYTSAQDLSALLGNSHTQYLKVTGFNLSVPANATICGVTVHIRKRATGINMFTTVKDGEVRIIKDGAITGKNKSTNTVWPTSFVTESYTGNAEYWGTPLTPKDVNDPQFGIAIAAQMSSTVSAFPSADIDHISIVVDYQPALASRLTVQNFTTILQKNVVNAEWTVAEEEPGAFITLQQSTDNRQWKDISSYAVSSRAAETKYRQVNRVSNKGTYYYRLKITDKDNKTTYSKTNTVQYVSVGEPKLYPTVAKSMIYLENIDPTDKVEVFTFSNQLMPTTTVQVNDNMVAIRISNLPKGMYLLKTGRTTKRFIKD